LSIKVWRICARKYAANALDGVGASKYGNRWNSKGFKMAYTSANLSLATLEFFVHVDFEDAQNLDLVSICAEIPDSLKIETLEPSQLPENWKAYDAPLELAKTGDQWLVAKRTAVLVVPSAITPTEYNYLLNPEHPDFSSINIAFPEPFTLDDRLWKKQNSVQP
jgi:RES domain-containing protein